MTAFQLLALGLALLSQFAVASPLPLSQKTADHFFEYARGCYFTNWAQYRQDKGKYLPEYYIPGLCTHIFYAFVVMDNEYRLKPFEWNDDSSEGTAGNYERVNALKKVQPDLKTLLSFGGYTFSQANAGLLSTMAATNESRRTFINSVIDFTRSRGFDGFDFDWEYPLEEDKLNFATLLKETREAVEQEAHQTGKPQLLLTAAVAAGSEKIDAGYVPSVMARTLDYINIMTYDFHGSWETTTGFNSPLFDRNGDHMAVSSAANYWVSKGIPRKKLLIGFGSYGRGWTLSSGLQNGVGVQTMTAAPAQNYTKEAGVAAYYEICQLLNDVKTLHSYDTVQQAPYLVKENVWFGYDDEKSFDAKLSWLKKNGFGGAFVWTLDQDDFAGQCPNGNNTRYPLISRIASRLGKALPMSLLRSNTTLAPSLSPQQQQWSGSSSPWPQQQPSNSSNTNSTTAVFHHCPGMGLFPDPDNCQTYYNCVQNGSAGSKMSCGAGTLFNPALKLCDWPHNVKCAQS